MTCLIKSRYKKELSHYAGILGSEEAAYYVLAMNNGYTLDLNPDGSPSELYMALTLVNGLDEDAAILSKSVVYTPLYIDKYGDWTENFDKANGSEEPSIDTLNNDAQLCDNNAIRAILADPNSTIDKLIAMELVNQLDRDPVISQAIREEKELYLLQKREEYESQSVPEDEIEWRLSYDEYNWYRIKLSNTVDYLKKQLRSIFGSAVKYDSSTETYYGTTPFSKILADILNNLYGVLYSNVFVRETGQIDKKNAKRLQAEQAEFTIITLLRQLILDVEPEIQLRTVIESYLRMFGNSEPMQEAFARLKDKFPNRSTDSMIREIADYISGDVSRTSRNREIHRAIEKFWLKFKNFLRLLIPRLHQKDYNTKRNILDSLTVYFSLLLNLDDAENEQIVRDINLWRSNPNKLKTTAKDVIKAIKSGIESRIKAIKSVTNNEFNQQELLTLEGWLSEIEDLSNIPELKIENEEFILIDQFLTRGLSEIFDANATLSSMEDLETSDINASQLLRIKTDIIGFYENIITQYINPLMRDSENPSIQRGSSVYNSISIILNAMSVIKKNFDALLERYTDYIADKFVDEQVDVGNKERLRINMKLWLRNKINNGELAFFDKYFSSGISSQSMVVRMLDTFLREARLSAHQGALCAKRLYKLYRKAAPKLDFLSFKNFCRQFCEEDSTGRLTGNFVSEINKGEFDRRFQEGLAKLDKKYGIKKDENGHRIFDNDDIWEQYQDEKDLLIEQIGGHRRYKAEYYIQRRKFLSKGTIELQTKIRRDIDRILAKCTEKLEINGTLTDVVVEANLEPADRQKLEELRKQQEELGNIYDIVRDPVSGRIVSIKEKEGVALQIAKEIIAWNNYKREYLKYKTNTKKYKDILQALIDKYGKDSYQVKLFQFKNSSRKLSDAYYEALFQALTPGDISYNRAELLARRKSIIDACRERQGYYEPNLDLLTDEMFAELQRIDIELQNDPPDDGEFDPDAYYRLVQERYVKKQGQDISYFEWLRQLYEIRQATDPNAIREFYDRFTYEKQTPSGTKIVPLSCFTYNGPIDEAKYVELEGSNFVDIDDSSEWYDENYDSEDENFIQPDKTIYKNPLYDKVKDVPFYQELIKTMERIWDLLPNISRLYKYQMPQRRGESNRLWLRKGFLKNAKAVFQESWFITERDTDYNEEFTRRPDGSIVETIPIRWVRKLDDPNIIDTNIVGAVAEMLEMALSFNMKQHLVPIMELVNFKLYGGFSGIGTQSTDLADRFRQHMSMYMYGRMRAGFRKFKKLSTVERILQKFTQKVNNVVWSKLMIHNHTSVGKNARDSFFSLMAEASGGKYFSMNDISAAAKKCFGVDILKGGPIGSIGSITVPTMTANLMQYNRVSGTIRDIFDGAELSHARRILGKTKTAEYTAIDYMYKGLVTEAIYHSYRLILNPSTGKMEFMNREQAEYAYVKAGATNAAGLKVYENATVTLRDAYYSDKDNIIQIKPEYLDIVCPIVDEKTGRRSRKLETRVSNVILERCSVINGMLDDMDRNVISQNYIGATFLLMRGWLLSLQIDYNKRGHDFAIYADGDTPINKENQSRINKIKNAFVDSGSLLVVQEDENYEGQYNFGTGTVDKGAWLGLIQAYTQWFKSGGYLRHMFGVNKMTDRQKMLVARMNLCIFAVIQLAIESFVLGSLLEGDPDNWVFLYLYNNAIASISERASQLWYPMLFFVLSELMQTPAVATAWFRDFESIPSAFMDLISMVYNWASNNEEDIEAYDVIKQGSYSQLKKYQRDLLKASSEIPGVNTLGIDNLYKNLSRPAVKSKSNWYYQILPTPWISYSPRYNNSTKPQKGIYGLLLENEKNNTEDIGFFQSMKNTLKGMDYEGEVGKFDSKKSKKPKLKYPKKKIKK